MKNRRESGETAGPKSPATAHHNAPARRLSFYLINGITLYRAVAAFALLYFLVLQKMEPFKWLLAASFFTDAIDGFLARRFRAISIAGARLDSVADDLTMAMGIAGIAVFKTEFIWDQLPLIFLLTGLYLLQLLLALIRYGKPTSFHTYFAKAAAVLQTAFMVLLFFLPQPPVTLFYVAAAVAAVDVLEEIVLVMVLRRWKANVKGLYWNLKKSNVV